MDFSDPYLTNNTFGRFVLTNAVRPGPGQPIIPRQGYRTHIFRDRTSGLRIPMISAAITQDKLFETFLALMEPLGEMVHVVLETSHGQAQDHHKDYRRKNIDTAVLASHFCDHEDMLLNDGCTGVAILSTRGPIELQFDEHKLIHVYANNLKPFRRILRDMGIRRRLLLPLISEAEHFHHTTNAYEDEFLQLCTHVGVADLDRVLTDEF